MARTHSTTSLIHKTALEVIDHLRGEDGICQHTSVALAAILGVSEQTIYVVRTHLESCPDAKGYRLPYRAKGPLVLVDSEKNLTTLDDLRTQRTEPIMRAFESVLATTELIRERNIGGIEALAKEAYASTDADLADVLEQAAVDVRTTGTLHPMTRLRLVQLGVLT